MIERSESSTMRPRTLVVDMLDARTSRNLANSDFSATDKLASRDKKSAKAERYASGGLSIPYFWSRR